MQQPLLALDIGSTKVACAIALPHERAYGFELLGSGVAAYPATAGEWLADRLLISRAIEEAVEATAVSLDVDRALVCFSHPALASEQVTSSINLADQPIAIRGQDCERLKRAALAQALGVDREPLFVQRLGASGNGFENVKDPRGLSATRLLGRFHILTMPISIRQAITQVVEAAGLEVAQLTHSLEALSGAFGEEIAAPRLLLMDVGGLTTDLGLFVDGQLERAAILPSGGQTPAGVIAQTLHVTMEQATLWTAEGASCRKAPARDIITEHWEKLKQAIDALLENQPQPDRVVISGRGALMDGFVEWFEQSFGARPEIGRSLRLSRMGDLSRQLALTPVMGLLETATRSAEHSPANFSTHLFNRLIRHTRAILTEYF